MQEAEQNAKQLLSNLQWSQQIVDRTSQLADQFPSQYAWCKAFLLDYSNLCKDFDPGRRRRLEGVPGQHEAGSPEQEWPEIHEERAW